MLPEVPIGSRSTTNDKLVQVDKDMLMEPFELIPMFLMDDIFPEHDASMVKNHHSKSIKILKPHTCVAKMAIPEKPANWLLTVAPRQRSEDTASEASYMDGDMDDGGVDGIETSMVHEEVSPTMNITSDNAPSQVTLTDEDEDELMMQYEKQ